MSTRFVRLRFLLTSSLESVFFLNKCSHLADYYPHPIPCFKHKNQDFSTHPLPPPTPAALCLTSFGGFPQALHPMVNFCQASQGFRLKSQGNHHATTRTAFCTPENPARPGRQGLAPTETLPGPVWLQTLFQLFRSQKLASVHTNLSSTWFHSHTLTFLFSAPSLARMRVFKSFLLVLSFTISLTKSSQ